MIPANLMSPKPPRSFPRRSLGYIMVLAVSFALAGLLLAIPACHSSSPAPPTPAPGQVEEEYKGLPLFEDVTSNSDVKMTYRNGEEANNFAIIESLGGGIALIDYDGD